METPCEIAGGRWRAESSSARAGEAAQAFVGLGVVREIVGRQTAAPVGVLLHRPRQIGLLVHFQNVFDGRKREQAGTLADVGERRIYRPVRLFRQWLGAPRTAGLREGGPQQRAILLA